MDTELVRSKVEEVNQLHRDVFEAFKLGLDGAIRIGKLLTECKNEVGHGGWMQWMKDNLEFSQRAAERYMRLYVERDNPKFDSLSNLWEAEQALINHKPIKEPEPQQPDHITATLPPEEELTDEVDPKKVAGVKEWLAKGKPNKQVEEPEEEIEEPEIDEQAEMVEEIKDLYERLDQDHKDQIIDWLFEQGRPVRKAA